MKNPFIHSRASTPSDSITLFPFLFLILLLSSLVITHTLASPINDDNGSNSDNNINNQQSSSSSSLSESAKDTRTVYVVIQDHGIHELTIPTNGDYAWDELPGIDIPDARITGDAPVLDTASPSLKAETGTALEEEEKEEVQQQQQQRHTTCFFWRSRDDGGVPYARHDAFVSPPIYSQRQSKVASISMTRPYMAAERLYCYDSTAEQTNRDVVTVFLQNSQEEQKLVRLPVSAEERSHAVAMSERSQASSSSSLETLLRDSSLKDFSDQGVTGMVLMFVPRRDSYCIADAGPREMFALEYGIALKFQPGKKLFSLECRY